MIVLQPVTPKNIATIKQWPHYPGEFRELDYALRDGGLLDEYAQRDGAEILIAEEDGTIAGFLVLVREPDGSTEFRIALHPEKLGLGKGKNVAQLALAHGFSDPGTRLIRLIVRKNNPRAKKLYEYLHFRNTGECIEEIQGNPVEFYRMEIDRDTFLRGNKE